MAMERWEQVQRQQGNIAGAEMAKVLREQYGDTPLYTEGIAKQAELKALETFSRDQLILPETALPQEVSDVLKRAEKVGIGVFEAYHLSDVTLGQNSSVEGWGKKPNNWYWEQIANGNISQDAPKLPGSWVLIDRTERPDYKDGKQLYKNDPFGPLLAQLRKEKKIQNVKGIPNTSRFGISPDELTQVVLPEIAKLLGIETSQVKLPKEIEFNIIGNMKHAEWGNANTWEWFDDSFGDARRLIGGDSDGGGLTDVNCHWSDSHHDRIGFRPLVVVSPNA